MKISTKGRYGLQAMPDLTRYSGGGQLAQSNIAVRQNISANYQEQEFFNLRKAGLVKSVKGAQGGYMLAGSPERISAGQILRVLEGELFQIDDEGAVPEDGAYVEYCLRTAVWERMQAEINSLADAISLEDLMAEYGRLQGNLSFMLHI